MTTAERQNARVLFVDDNDEVRSIAQRLLTGLGYDVTVMAGAVAALDVLEASAHSLDGPGRRPFDLVITDIEMRGINGVDLATRALRRWPTLRVLFISGQADDTPERQTIDRLGLPFLSKPYTSTELDGAVRVALLPLTE